MKTRFAALMTALMLMALPVGAMAMEQDHSGHQHSMEKMEKMDHGMMHDEHGGMAMHGDMFMLGNDTEDGVTAMAHMKDVSAAMAKMQMKETHHFMVMFTDDKTGEPVNAGTVAVKIIDPMGKEIGPVQLMGMQGHFGADVALTEKGEYKFIVGTKLADEKKRQFEFGYVAE